MRKLGVLVVVLLCATAVGVFALPSTFLQADQTDGWLGAGVMIAYDVAHGSVALEAELFWGMTSRFGIGMTWMVGLPDFSLGNFSFDGLYWWDWDTTGYGAAVVPVKLRLAVDGSSGSDIVFGAGLAAGLEYYAWSLYDTGDMFVTLKGLAEVDLFSSGRLDAWIEGGSFLEGTSGSRPAEATSSTTETGRRRPFTSASPGGAEPVDTVQRRRPDRRIRTAREDPVSRRSPLPIVPIHLTHRCDHCILPNVASVSLRYLEETTRTTA